MTIIKFNTVFVSDWNLQFIFSFKLHWTFCIYRCSM